MTEEYEHKHEELTAETYAYPNAFAMYTPTYSQKSCTPQRSFRPQENT